MAQLYVWTKDSDSWGHASLSLDNGIYISWWPKDDKSKNSMKKKKTDGRTKDRLPDNYNDEEENFTGRRYTHMFNISSIKIDIGKIKSWWQEIKSKGGYHFLFNNCCDCVVKALKAGGAKVKAPALLLVTTPNDMVNLGRDLES